MIPMRELSQIMARMVVYEDPQNDDPVEVRVLLCLADGNTKTFSQLEVLCGITDPAWARNPEGFSDLLDKTLRNLMSEGKVLLVARLPELCFRRGTVLDEIVKKLDGP